MLSTKRSATLAAWLLCLASATTTHAAPEPARRADNFVDAMGVCTHWGYPDTPYGYTYDRVKALLGATGLRHVRDGFHERERDLFETFGIKTTMIFGPQQPIAESVSLLKNNLHLVEMVEGPNEVDLFAGNAQYAGQVFPEGARRYRTDLNNALKADPATRRLPVIAPSTARRGSNNALAPLGHAVDHLVMHSYAGGQMPSTSLDNPNGSNLAEAFRLVGTGGGVLKPVVVTESGYHTALGSSVVLAGAQPGVSEKAQGKYLPRLFAEYFNAGIRRTFTYEFLDEFPDYDKDEREATNAEACFGILKRDLKPKPAYHAVRTLIDLLKEASWDAKARRWKRAAFSPRALDFTLTGQTKDVHHTLLQKADGDFYLLLWREVSSFDTKTNRDLDNPPARVTLRTAVPLRAVTVYNVGVGAKPLTSVADPKQLSLSVPDELLVVRLTPAIQVRVATLSAAPTNLAAITTGTEATLRWKPVKNASGYFVWRLDRLAACVNKPAFADARLTPGLGYPYAVAAFDRAGNVSPRACVVAATKAVFPDLVVTDITSAPDNPKPGDAVTFSAVVTNRGTAPTQAKVTVGVYFSVDGKGVAWSDTFAGPLAPGQSRTLAASNGPTGTKLWTATTGTLKITAQVDDVNRISESDESNNAREVSLEVR